MLSFDSYEKIHGKTTRRQYFREIQVLDIIQTETGQESVKSYPATPFSPLIQGAHLSILRLPFW